MARIIVGLFTSASEAEFAAAQLRAAGFAGSAVQLATRETLRAQLLPGPEAPPETFQDGIERFFSGIFSGQPLDDAAAYIAATGPDHAVITVDTTTAAPPLADSVRISTNASRPVASRPTNGSSTSRSSNGRTKPTESAAF